MDIFNFFGILFTLIGIFSLVKYFKIAEVNKLLVVENTNLKKNLQKNKISYTGRKAIMPYGLTETTLNKNFSVTYEVQILESSENKIKVSATDFSSTDKVAINNYKSIIDFMQNKWVSKDTVELINDKSDERNHKIQEILS